MIAALGVLLAGSMAAANDTARSTAMSWDAVLIMGTAFLWAAACAMASHGHSRRAITVRRMIFEPFYGGCAGATASLVIFAAFTVEPIYAVGVAGFVGLGGATIFEVVSAGVATALRLDRKGSE